MTVSPDLPRFWKPVDPPLVLKKVIRADYLDLRLLTRPRLLRPGVLHAVPSVVTVDPVPFDPGETISPKGNGIYAVRSAYWLLDWLGGTLRAQPHLGAFRIIEVEVDTDTATILWPPP